MVSLPCCFDANGEADKVLLSVGTERASMAALVEIFFDLEGVCAADNGGCTLGPDLPSEPDTVAASVFDTITKSAKSGSSSTMTVVCKTVASSSSSEERVSGGTSDLPVTTVLPLFCFFCDLQLGEDLGVPLPRLPPFFSLLVMDFELNENSREPDLEWPRERRDPGVRLCFCEIES